MRRPGIMIANAPSVVLIARDAPDHYGTAVTKRTFDGRYSTDSVIVTLSIALAYYNAIEMVLLMVSTFKKWKGLYFWSLAGCTVGVTLYTLGIMLSYFDLCALWLNLVILDIGWLTMLTCQSLVLYSRLGIILNNSTILCAVKWMIIFDSTVLGIIVIILNMGSAFSSIVNFTKGYYYIEQIQLIWFTVQELIISGLYVWKTTDWLKSSLKENTRSIIWQLFVINVIIIAMDIAIVTLQYLHYQLYQEAIKGFVYSVKLKLELNILSKLVDLVEGGASHRSMTLDFIDSTSVTGTTDLQREASGQLSRSNTLGNESKHKSKGEFPNGQLQQGSEVSSESPSGADDEISRAPSNLARYSSRTSGRETDFLYADMLRSLK